MRAHLIAAFSILGSGVFVGGGVGRGIHDDAVEEGVVLLGSVEQFVITQVCMVESPQGTQII